MSRAYRSILLLVFVLTLIACNLMALPTQAPPATATVSASETLVFTATIAASETPFPTDTAAPSKTPPPPTESGPTIPPEETLTPGIAATYAAFIANQTEMVGTEAAQLGPMAHMLGYLIFYSNPVGTPLQNWHDIPIMPQATAGQEFQADIYSYKASATFVDATRFYAAKSSSLGWSCVQSTGNSGTGSSANHSTTFLCQGFLLNVTSFDNDPNHVLVVINKAP